MIEVPSKFRDDANGHVAARICELAAHIHAATAELARLSADYDDTKEWCGVGLRTMRHWLTINTGLGERSADELLRVGVALRELPKLAEAFSEGRLSLDKLRYVTRVARPCDEDLWLEIALAASGAQLQRICRAHLSTGDDGTVEQEKRMERRGLWTYWREDGMLDLHAILPGEDAAVVLRALDLVADRTGLSEDRLENRLNEPSYDERSARRVMALPAICDDVLTRHGEMSVEATPAHPRRPHRVVVHVDLDVLTGASTNGLCHLEDGRALAASVAQRLGCDAEIATVIERNGIPVDTGRARYTVSPRMRRVLAMRDRGCRFPGCHIPARFTDAHHVQHWPIGKTELRNLLSLCRYHHTRHHDGAFRIDLDETGRPQFRNRWGGLIGQSLGPPLRNLGRSGIRELLATPTARITAQTPIAGDGGARFDPDYACQAIHSGCAARAQPHQNVAAITA